VVRRLQPDDTYKLQFRQKSSLMSRHLPLAYPPGDLALPENEKPWTLPIKEILVGPARNLEVSRISVGDLLIVCGSKGQRARFCNTHPIPLTLGSRRWESGRLPM
jgi:hypothetical protein